MEKYLIVETIQNFGKISSKKQAAFLQCIIFLCELELQLIDIDITDKAKLYFDPLILDTKFISKFYSEDLLNTIDELVLSEKNNLVTSVFHILTETIEFLDQLPFENLLSDTYDKQQDLLDEIKKIKNQILP